MIIAWNCSKRAEAKEAGQGEYSWYFLSGVNWAIFVVFGTSLLRIILLPWLSVVFLILLYFIAWVAYGTGTSKKAKNFTVLASIASLVLMAIKYFL